MTLTEQTSRALAFRLSGSVLDVGVSIGLGIVLARILPPEEFGLFAVAMTIVAMAEMLSSCGMLPALVQRQELVREHESAAAIFQIGGAFILSAGLFYSASSIADWFGMPALAIILRLQPAILVIDAFAVVPEARLTRRLAFDRLTVIQCVSKMLGGALALVAAMRGLGALAFVVGSISSAFVRMMLLWLCAPGLVAIRCQWQHFWPLFNFGSAVLITNLINQLAQRLDVLIIGRLVGTAGVGLYQRAIHLGLLPLTQLIGPVNKVLFPSMSSIQNEAARFRRGYLATLRVSTLLAFPILMGLWTTSDIVVPLVYGPMWEGVVPILQVICLAGFFRILTNSQGLIARAQGLARAEAVRQTFWLGMVVVFGIIGSRNGVLGVAMGVCLATVIFFISMTHFSLPLVGVSVSEFLDAVRTGILGCFLMSMSTFLAKNVALEGLSPILRLCIISSIGLVVYIATVRSCLSTEDAKVVELIAGALPARLGELLRSVFGIDAAKQFKRLQETSRVG
jgi:O-antigen/teichoic acid export membrane protein